jgi:hypothetical protein
MLEDWTEDIKGLAAYNDTQLKDLDITQQVHDQRAAQLQEFQNVVGTLTNLAASLKANAGIVGNINLNK